MFQAGTKDNVLASRARAVVNFRILPGDSVAGVVEHVRRVVGDPRVDVKPAGNFSAEPSAISSTESTSFRTLERTIQSVVPDAVVAPYLVVVVTDSRYFGELSSNVFRFLPIRLTAQDLDRMHGTNERIAVRDYHQAIRVYRQLIRNSAGS
jgi:carboxypeptidase PM20D1